MLSDHMVYHITRIRMLISQKKQVLVSGKHVYVYVLLANMPHISLFSKLYIYKLKTNFLKE